MSQLTDATIDGVVKRMSMTDAERKRLATLAKQGERNARFVIATQARRMGLI